MPLPIDLVSTSLIVYKHNITHGVMMYRSSSLWYCQSGVGKYAFGSSLSIAMAYVCVKLSDEAAKIAVLEMTGKELVRKVSLLPDNEAAQSQEVLSRMEVTLHQSLVQHTLQTRLIKGELGGRPHLSPDGLQETMSSVVESLTKSYCNTM